MDQTVARFLATYLPANDLRPAYRELQDWAERGEVGLLVALLVELERSGAAAEPGEWAPQSLADRIERVLALTPGFAQAEATLTLAATPRRSTAPAFRSDQQRQVYLAALLAAAQSPVVLRRLFESQADAQPPGELIAALLHELVVRGHDAAPVPVLRDTAARLAAQGHPLAWLPLRLLAVEHSFLYALPRYSYDGTTKPRAALPQAQLQHDQAQPGIPSLRDMTRPEAAERVAAAVAGWRDESNGTVEARIIASDPPLRPEALGPRLLAQLGLACLSDADLALVRLYRLSAADVARQLFSAAAVGGAYGGGRGGAYGRLATWRSLGALAGLAEGASFEQCAAGVEACAWWGFTAPGPWFANVAWDIGLVALRPGGATLAVLAATDTD